MAELLLVIFEEDAADAVQDIPWSCVSTILRAFDSIDQAPHLLAADLLKSCPQRFSLCVGKRFCQLCNSEDDTLNEKEQAAELQWLEALLPKLAKLSPQLLNATNPHLGHLLLSEDPQCRLQNVKVVASILPFSISCFEPWMGRRNDKSQSVRVAWVKCAVGLLTSVTFNKQAALLNGYMERLEDPDWQVRVKVLQGLLEAKPKMLDSHVDLLLDRCKDKREEVRAVALQVVCSMLRSNQEAMAGLFQLFAAVQDVKLRVQMEEVIEEMLLDCASSDDGFEELLAIADAVAEDHLKAFIRSKAVNIKHMEAFCLLMERPEEAAKLDRLIQMMADRQPFPQEAASTLANISELKDRDEVMAALKALKNPATPISACEKLLAYLRTNHASDSLHQIARRASHRLFNQQFIQKFALVDSDKKDKLLFALVNELPQLFAKQGSYLEDLLRHHDMTPDHLAAFYQFFKTFSSWQMSDDLLAVIQRIVTGADSFSRLQVKQASLILSLMKNEVELQTNSDHPNYLQVILSVAVNQKLPVDFIEKVQFPDGFEECKRYPRLDELSDNRAIKRILGMRIMKRAALHDPNDPDVVVWKREAFKLFRNEIALPSQLSLVKSLYLGKVRWQACKGLLSLIPLSNPKFITNPDHLGFMSIMNDPVETVRVKFYNLTVKLSKKYPVMYAFLTLSGHDSSFKIRSLVH